MAKNNIRATENKGIKVEKRTYLKSCKALKSNQISVLTIFIHLKSLEINHCC